MTGSWVAKMSRLTDGPRSEMHPSAGPNSSKPALQSITHQKARRRALRLSPDHRAGVHAAGEFQTPTRSLAYAIRRSGLNFATGGGHTLSDRLVTRGHR